MKLIGVWVLSALIGVGAGYGFDKLCQKVGHDLADGVVREISARGAGSTDVGCHLDVYTCEHGQLYRLHLANHHEGDEQDCEPIPDSAPRDPGTQTWFDEKIPTPHTTNCPKNYAGYLDGRYPVLYVPSKEIAKLKREK